METLCGTLNLEAHNALFMARPLIAAAIESCWEDPLRTTIEVDEQKEVPAPEWDPASLKLGCRLQEVLPQRTWQYITTDLYLLFWSLSLQDIILPEALYEKHISTLRSRAQAHRCMQGESDKHRRDAIKSLAVLEQLEHEFDKQHKHHRLVLGNIEARKESLMVRIDTRCPCIAEELTRKLILPRLTLTLSDALFCAHFFLHLHTIGTPYFNSLEYFDSIIKEVLPMIYVATEQESVALGMFLKVTLEPLKSWRMNETAYIEQAGTLLGFMVDGVPCPYADFCFLFSGWYDTITRTVLLCLSDFANHGRACLLLLIKVHVAT